MKYIALLRGINVGGNNKVSMADLKLALGEAGLTNVTTYINSGNVLFEANNADIERLTDLCERTIEQRFGFLVNCVVLSADSFRAAIDSAPTWWANGDVNMRSDALFVLRHGSASAVITVVGPVNNDYEWVDATDNVVFWTIDKRKYGKARLPKIIGSDAYRALSMRSSTTARKLYALLDT